MERVDHQRNRAQGVFIQREKDGVQQITYAREAWQGVDDGASGKDLVLLDGYYYELDSGDKRDRIVRFETYQLPLVPKEISSLELRRKATPTFQLALSKKSSDQAEFQWRLSTGFSTVLLGLLGIPLSRTAPRRGKSAKLFSAVIIFAVYYNITALAKTWVEQGLVGSFPGVWWAPVLLAVLVAVLIRHPGYVSSGAS